MTEYSYQEAEARFVAAVAAGEAGVGEVAEWYGLPRRLARLKHRHILADAKAAA